MFLPTGTRDGTRSASRRCHYRVVIYPLLRNYARRLVEAATNEKSRKYYKIRDARHVSRHNIEGLLEMAQGM